MGDPERPAAVASFRAVRSSCPECESPLVHAEGCAFCSSCDYSRCG